MENFKAEDNTEEVILYEELLQLSIAIAKLHMNRWIAEYEDKLDELHNRRLSVLDKIKEINKEVKPVNDCLRTNDFDGLGEK
jgi:hypothetical protein